MIQRIIALYMIVAGLLMMLAACTNLTDVLCPAGQCPNAPDGLGKDH
jgi:hypothetical protein